MLNRDISDSSYLLPFEKRKSEILIKQDVDTNLDYGKFPENRTVEELIKYGIVNIDKPSGPTSHQVSAFVKDILGIPKAGHSGTLDPAVTGVLPVGLDRGARIMQSLLTAGKEYVCLMHLHEDYDKDAIIDAMKKYTGTIKQLPPVKSAVKREYRERNVYYIDVLDIDGRDVLFKIGCQAGTYIRKWVHDFGLLMGSGAHMAELRRTKAGPFNELTAVTLQDLKDAFYYYKTNGDDSKIKKVIQNPENGVSHLRKIFVTDSAINSLCHGAYLKVPGIAKLDSGIPKDEFVAVMSLKNELVLVGKSFMTTGEMIKAQKGIAVETLQVFMDPETYPRI